MTKACIETFEEARRNLIQLWKAKHSLNLAAQARFPKSHSLYKSILKICHRDPTCQLRFLADKSACQCADRYGDDLFRREVDGEVLPAVTLWFYGISHHLPDDERVPLNRTKTFGAVEIKLYEEVGRCAKRFIASVSQLPDIDARDFAREVKKFDQCYAKAGDQIEKVSSLYVAYRCLLDALPHGIVDRVVGFCGE